ncbi:hypothetical protein CRG98_027893 [Punica granatum]|nr:hypothetical protein CRG98_027893 [Punica granatum]
MSSLKDYALKALVNTVDHLGSMSYKVNCLLNEKSDELSTIELPFSCFEQRLQACQQFINHGGLSQQSLLHKTHNHHTHYVLPDLREMSKEPPTSFIRRGQPPTAHVPESSPVEVTFSFTEASPHKRSDKRATSPFRFQLMRSGSLASRSSSPTPSSSNTKRRYPSEPRRSASPSARADRDRANDLELYASKNKRMFRALLNMRKPKKGGSLYKYLDEN